MLSREENEVLTRTGPGTPGGELMRRYWQPAALDEELPPGGPPIPVRLLGEDLVLFRDEQGRAGLLGLHCSHRGADLSYGRLEDSGLRCIYHGWLYDVRGRCLEQPGEPSNSWTSSRGRDSMESSGSVAQTEARGRPFHENIRHTAYPCREKGGIIFAYLGPGEPPLLPEYEFLNAPQQFRFVTKYFQECNYLQANEGNLDQAHLSFLHRKLSYGRDEHQAYITVDTSPILEPEETDFGLRIYSVRRVAPERNHVKISNFLVPNAAAFGGGIGDGYSVHYHVPIDDEHHWKYVFHFRRSSPLAEAHIQQFRSEITAEYRLIRNGSNRYLQDREEMQVETFSGMGSFFHAQDACVTEGAGPIQDRTQEHLGYTDRPVIAARQLLLRAIAEVEAGRDPHHVLRDPSANRFPHLVARADEIPSELDWKTYWQAEAAVPGTGAILGAPAR